MGIPGLGLVVAAACLLQLAAATPVKADNPAIVRRDKTVTVTEEATSFVTYTATVNPLDPTVTSTATWTWSTVVPSSITTQTITTDCITYEHVLPPPGPDTTTTTTTVTRTYGTTLTVTDANRQPLTTYTTTSTPAVTITTQANTYHRYHCTNTMVVSYADWEHLTWTWSVAHPGRPTTTDVCLTTVTRSTTIPGFAAPSGTAEPADWEWFTEPGVTRVTKKTVAIWTDTSVELGSGDGGVFTVCNSLNPRPVVTSTWTAVTQTTTRTQTVTSQAAGCATPTPTPPPGLQRRARGGKLEGRQKSTWFDDLPPREVLTVVYTTVTVVDNTVHTLTGTAVVDVLTQVFPTTRVKYTTITGTGRVVTETVCF
ncbi:hypothetical protein VTJ83DRAFT_6317 [Remersonia thermophila]|uniref:Uncharacterized protein n=1 Tax=Remersonia thermophila TaxID=72144 RepID=A0ABR4D6N4_9PEZI